jgi:hypothetical protein
MTPEQAAERIKDAGTAGEVEAIARSAGMTPERIAAVKQRGERFAKAFAACARPLLDRIKRLESRSKAMDTLEERAREAERRLASVETRLAVAELRANAAD